MGVLVQEKMQKKSVLVYIPFRPVHGQGHQLAACSDSRLVSTRLTLGKYSCDQTLSLTGTRNKASVSEKNACSLPGPAHLFPGKVKINPGHSQS